MHFQILPKTKVRYIAFTTSIGSALEYYSFIIYIMLASYLGKLFFPTKDPHTAMLAALLVFAVSYIVAPLGAFGFSFIADRIGRKQTMIISLTLMALASLLIGILPTYQSIGITATVLLFAFRILQGIACGAELPGAIVFLSEHAHDKHQGRFSGLLFFAIASGALISTLVISILTSLLNEKQMLTFGWRIPFLLAATLGIIGYKIRKNIPETESFTKQKQIAIARIPILLVIKEYLPQVLIGFGLVWTGAALVNFGLFAPAFLQSHFGYTAKETYFAMSSGFAVAFFLIIFGAIADIISFKRFYFIGILLNILLLYPVFHLLTYHSLATLFAFNILTHLMVLLLASSYPSMIARLFVTKVRYSGVSLAYIGAYSLAGLVPFILSYLYNSYASLWVLIGFFGISSLMSLIACICYKDRGMLRQPPVETSIYRV